MELSGRDRRKASFNTASRLSDTRVILEAMKTYGIILADNDANWRISGAPDEHWNNDERGSAFGRVKGSGLEAVDVSGLMVNLNTVHFRVSPVES